MYQYPENYLAPISYSLLTSLDDPATLKKKWRNELPDTGTKDYFRVGRGVDVMLTEPDKYEKRFIVVEAYKPSGLMGKFVEALPKSLTKDSPEEDYQYAYFISGYKWSISKVIETFWKNAYAVKYYNYIRNTPDDRITRITPDDNRVIHKCVEALNSSGLIKYFTPQSITEEVLLQKKIEFKLKGYKAKTLFDGIKIDHVKKTILPFDLKTTGKAVYDFKDSFLKFGYYIQAALYLVSLRHDKDIRKLMDDGYEVLPFEFIVVSKKVNDYTPAMLYRVSKKLSQKALDGFTHEGVTYKGLYELVDDYLFHITSGEWRWKADYAKTGGVGLLDF